MALLTSITVFGRFGRGQTVHQTCWAIWSHFPKQVPHSGGHDNCFHVDNMKELFQDIHIDSIMTFLRQINLFNKI